MDRFLVYFSVFTVGHSLYFTCIQNLSRFRSISSKVKELKEASIAVAVDMSGNSESQSTPMSPHSAVSTSSSSWVMSPPTTSSSKLPSPEPSPGLTGSKRPCQGEMSEAPDLKRLHAVSSLAGDFCPSVKVEHESYEDPTAVSVQGKDGK